MSVRINQMITILKEMAEMCGRLLSLIASERQALVEVRIDILPQIAQAKTEVVRALAEKRNQAKLLAAELNPLGGAAKATTIDRLLPLLPDEDRQKLSGPYLDYLTKAREVELFNANNKLLAQQGLKTMEGAINDLATMARGTDATYHRPTPGSKYPRVNVGRVRREA